jgi:glycosyltransferase involved in cell wall biosynthesis
MNGPRKTYSGKDVAIIIPTKDRPGKIRNLLNSLADQTTLCGRVIVVDGGYSVKGVVTEFVDKLPVEHYMCEPPGQIRQRNMGKNLLDERTFLIGSIDDDIVLEQDALEKMIDFWNHTDINTAGVGFNGIHLSVSNYSNMFSRLLTRRLTRRRIPGRVLSCGINASIENVSSDIRTQWLGGGFTVWKREILKEFPQDDLRTRWAAGEDLRFSYPIGKKYPLYVCAGAKIYHEHTYDQAPKGVVYVYQGRKQSLAVFYFVGLHKELSRVKCLLMLLRSFTGNFVFGCAAFNLPLILFSFGRMQGIFICLKSLFGYADLRKELED